MRDVLFKIAVILGFISIAPLVILISRRENPPKHFRVEVHNKQIVKNFTLKSSGWTLKAPFAELKENCISLKSPRLKVFSKKLTTITAKKACYQKQSNTCSMNDVRLSQDDVVIATPFGTYYGKTNSFKSSKPCSIRFNGNSTIKGNGCIANLKAQRFIILNGVKSILRGTK